MERKFDLIFRGDKFLDSRRAVSRSSIIPKVSEVGARRGGRRLPRGNCSAAGKNAPGHLSPRVCGSANMRDNCMQGESGKSGELILNFAQSRKFGTVLSNFCSTVLLRRSALFLGTVNRLVLAFGLALIFIISRKFKIIYRHQSIN